MGSNDDGRPTSDISSPTIVGCDPHQVKPHHGWYNRQKTFRKSCTEITKNDVPTLGTAKNTPTLFVKTPWDSSYVDHVL